MDFDINKYLDKLPYNIKILDISNRNILVLPDLSRFRFLEKLYCQYNELKELPELNNTLIELDCSFNNLEKLPELNDNLKILDCNNNQLTELPELNYNLVKLYCQSNNLIKLPELNDKLELLNCTNNRLVELPELNFNLKKLICSFNNLTIIPPLNENLLYLFCDYNNIVKIPELNKKLKELNCNYNELTELPIINNDFVIINSGNNNINFNKKRPIIEINDLEPIIENKYKIVDYKKRKFSYSDEKINKIFFNLKNINDIINLKDKWEEIRHDIKLQKIYNLIPALEKLNNMIGLKNIKEDIFKVIIYYIQNEYTDEYLHTVIEGPPGVGKTEFAKIYADIFVRLGILKKDTFVEIKRTDLVAKYLGQTSHQTKNTLDKALGGVLFLDEAYSLGNEEKRDSFAKEAIDMLNQYLSEKKNQFMFIIAGYKDDLDKCFFAYNKGLRRRFSHHFEINNYNYNELADIFKYKINSYNYILDPSIDIYQLFKNNYNKFPYFGGDIEKLFNYIKYEQSLRTFKENINNKTITINDINESLKKFVVKEVDKPPLNMYI